MVGGPELVGGQMSLIQHGASWRACGMGAGVLGMAMGHSAKQQHMGHSQCPHLPPPLGGPYTDQESQALHMAFGNITILCVPSAGALGLSSPDWGWAE